MQVKKTPAKQETAVSNMLVPLDHIVTHKEIISRALDQAHVDSLVADIAANGLDTPLFTFAETPTHQVKLKGTTTLIPATYLVAGFHRRAALLKLRREQPAVFKAKFGNGIPVIHEVSSVAEAIMRHLRENVSRREMSAEEIFPVLEKLAGPPYRLTGKEIAKKVGRSTAWVSMMMAVNTELDEDTRGEIAEGKIAVGDARKLAGDVRTARKSGAPLKKEEIREKAEALKQKTSTKQATGSQRASGDDRKVSLKKIWGRYQALTSVTVGRRKEMLEEAIQYTLDLRKTLPAELRIDREPADKK